MIKVYTGEQYDPEQVMFFRTAETCEVVNGGLVLFTADRAEAVAFVPAGKWCCVVRAVPR